MLKLQKHFNCFKILFLNCFQQQTLIAHIWELGGGTNLYKLLDVPLNIQIIQDLTVVLVRIKHS